MILYSCSNIGFLRTIMYTKSIITLIFLVVPIILLTKLGVDIAKGVLVVDDDMWGKIGKKVFAAIILFLIPTLVKFSFSNIEDVNDQSFLCYSEATSENIEKIAEQNVEEYMSGLDSSKITLSQIAALEKKIEKIPNKEAREKYKAKLDEYKKVYNAKQEEIEKKESEERAKVRQKQEERKKSGSKKDKTIFIGDSETVAMCGNYNLCEGTPYVAKIGEGYYWFVNTAIPEVNNKMGSDAYNIVIILGSNGVGETNSEGKYESEKYFNKVSSLAKGDWKKHNVIYVSINPCDDAVAASNGYYIKQTAIDTFNANMKSSIASAKISNLSYCDTATGLNMKEIDAGDGLHYNKKGAQQVYDKIKNNCLK